MTTTVTVFSIAECCQEGKALIYEQVSNDIIPIGEFVQHARECDSCAKVLNGHLAAFIHSLPAPARMIAKKFERQITGG